MAEVRAHAGVPVAAQFYGLGAPSLCPPVVVNSSTGCIYTLTSAGTVVEVCGVSTIAAILMESGVSTKTTAFPAAAALTGTEIVGIVQGGVNVQTTVAAIIAGAIPALPFTSVQFNNSGVFGGSANLVFVSPTTTAHTLTVSTGPLSVVPGTIRTTTTQSMNLQVDNATHVTIEERAWSTNPVNTMKLSGSNAATSSPGIETTGSDTNVPLYFGTKGTGSYRFYTTGASYQITFELIQSTSSGSDYSQVHGGLGNTYHRAQGPSSAIAVNNVSKGTGPFNFFKDSSATPVAQITIPAGAPADYPRLRATDGGTVAFMSALGSSVSILTTGAGGSGNFVEFRRDLSSTPSFSVWTDILNNAYFNILPQLGDGPILQVLATGGITTAPIYLKTLGTASVVTNPGSGTTLTLDSSTATTVNVYPTPTTVNIGAAATTLTFGAAAATFSIGANSGTLTIGNPTVVGTQTTQALWNTVATTVNFAGAATTLNIGAATGTASLKNATVTLPNATSVAIGTDPGGANLLRIGGALTINSAVLISTKTNFTNGAGVGIGTLTNAPTAGDPTKWIPVDDNGTTRYLPAW